jgi:hypothetical protein
MSYTNADGLLVLTNGDAGIPAETGNTAVFSKKTLVVKIDLTKGGQSYNAPNDAFIPAGSYITEASIVVLTAAAGGTNATFGLVDAASNFIDADGLNVAVTTANLAANRAVSCSGDLVAGTVTIGALDGYVGISTAGTFTAGELLLVIEYIEP